MNLQHIQEDQTMSCFGRRAILSALTIALLVGPVVYADPIGSDPVPARPDYFPVRLGWMWEYTEGGLIALADVAMEPDSSTVYLLKTSMAGLQAFVREGDRVFEVLDGDRRLWYDFSAPVGESWTIEPFDGSDEDMMGGATVTVQSRADEVRVPYGTFSECIHFAFTPPPNLADAGLLDQWFAPGVGLVKMTVQTIAGPLSYELIELVDRDIPEPPPPERVTVEVLTDRDTYDPEDPIEITVVAHNPGEEEVTLEFRNSLQANYTIDWTYNWAVGKAFTDALTQVTIPAGGAHEWTFTHSPEDARLLAGEHVIVGEIVGHRASGSTVIQIEGPVGVVRGSVIGDDRALSGVEVSLWTMMEWYDERPVPPEPARDVLVPVKFHRTAATDHDGRFVFEDVPVGGTYSINAFAEGFEPFYDTFEMETAEKTLDISLARSMDPRYVHRYVFFRDGVRYEIGATDRWYPRDGTVEMIYRVSNAERESVTFSFSSGQRYDFALADAAGNAVWGWSWVIDFAPTASEITLRRGEFMEFEETLDLSGLETGGWMTLSGWLTTSSPEETKLSLPLWIEPSGELAVLQGTVIEDRGPLKIWAPLEGVQVIARPDAPVWGGRPDWTDAEKGEEGTSSSGGGSGSVSDGDAPPASSVEVAGDDPTWSNDPDDLIRYPGPLPVEPPVGILEAVTAADGTFRIEGLYPGVRYWVYVFKEGYESQTTAITVEPGENDLVLALPRQESIPYLNVISDYREGMQYEIGVHRHFYGPSDSVQVRYRVTNVDRDLVTLEFSSTQQYDFVLWGEAGDLWRWSDGKGFGEIMQTVPLERGRSLTFKETFSLADLDLEGPVALSGYLTLSNFSHRDLVAEDTEISVKFFVGEAAWSDLVPVEVDWDEADGSAPVEIRVSSEEKSAGRAMEVRVLAENAYGPVPGHTFVRMVEVEGDNEGSNALVQIRYDLEALNTQGIDANVLKVFYLNAENVWEPAESWVNEADNVVQAELPYLGTVGLFARNALPTPVDDDRPAVPHTFALAQNHPNPFNPSTTISFLLPARALVRLEIYNAMGQRIRTLVNEEVEGGERQVVWDGRDDAERSVASGVYFCRLLADGGRWTAARKMMLVR